MYAISVEKYFVHRLYTVLLNSHLTNLRYIISIHVFICFAFRYINFLIRPNIVKLCKYLLHEINLQYNRLGKIKTTATKLEYSHWYIKFTLSYKWSQ